MEVEEDGTEMSVAAREGADDTTVSPLWGRASHFPRFSGYRNKQTQGGKEGLQSAVDTGVHPSNILQSPCCSRRTSAVRPSRYSQLQSGLAQGGAHTQGWRGRGIKACCMALLGQC